MAVAVAAVAVCVGGWADSRASRSRWGARSVSTRPSRSALLEQVARATRSAVCATRTHDQHPPPPPNTHTRYKRRDTQKTRPQPPAETYSGANCCARRTTYSCSDLLRSLTSTGGALPSKSAMRRVYATSGSFAPARDEGAACAGDSERWWASPPISASSSSEPSVRSVRWSTSDDDDDDDGDDDGESACACAAAGCDVEPLPLAPISIPKTVPSALEGCVARAVDRWRRAGVGVLGRSSTCPSWDKRGWTALRVLAVCHTHGNKHASRRAKTNKQKASDTRHRYWANRTN